jgi:signal transduction histidine kinase
LQWLPEQPQQMRFPVLEWPARHPARMWRPRTAGERRRVESVLAIARLILVSAALAADAFLPQLDGARIAVRTLTSAYAVQAVIAAGFLFLQKGSPGVWPIVLQILDIVWAATLTVATGGPQSPLVVLFTFCLLGAAYRWGLPETVWTGVASLVIFTAEAALPLNYLIGGAPAPLDVPAIFMRGTFFIIGAIVLGYVAEEDQRHHAEATVVADVLAHVQAEVAFRPALRDVAAHLLEVFDARQLILIAVDAESRRAVCWEATIRDGQLALQTEPGDVSAPRRDLLQFPAPGHSVRVVRRRNGCQLISLDVNGNVLDRFPCAAPASLWVTPARRAATIVNLQFADRWHGRVALLFDRTPTLVETRLFQRIVGSATPVMYNHYLLRRLRTRIAATVRLRVARELHDSVLQSIAGLELQMGALRASRESAIRAAGLDADLSRLQRLLRDEAATVRELMQRIRPMDIARGQIVRVFADLVTRFERNSGIAAKFSADVEGADIPPATARELGRTLQEALQNVRKHSAARHVDVEFTTEDGLWKLVIANDGRPFDFNGRLTLRELEAQQRGPRVIKERVREMGGDLAIESTPARGVRLEVTVPRT